MTTGGRSGPVGPGRAAGSPDGVAGGAVETPGGVDPIGREPTGGVDPILRFGMGSKAFVCLINRSKPWAHKQPSYP